VEHARLAAHWERTLPGRIVPIRYEEFAANFENAAPALVRACGLEWEPQCLDAGSSPWPVAAFGSADLEDRGSVQDLRAPAYARHLDPLVDRLRAGEVAFASLS
jgi:hypothetical protein